MKNTDSDSLADAQFNGLPDDIRSEWSDLHELTSNRG